MKYYEKPEHVLIYNPIVRLIKKVFKEFGVKRCKACNKMPTELIGDNCIKCDRLEK